MKSGSDKKFILICLAIIVWTVIVYRALFFFPADRDALRAAALYAEILEKVKSAREKSGIPVDTEIDPDGFGIIGLDYSEITTTQGSLAAKRSTGNRVTAALIVKLLKEAGVSKDSRIAINASGSFPGFVMASLAACSALHLDADVIISIGASSYGANTPGFTIADMLLSEDVLTLLRPNRDYRLIAVTPGGSDDRGAELDADELERVSGILAQNEISFMRPQSLEEAIDLRVKLFLENNCDILINIGGSHASGGGDAEISLLSGLIKPDDVKKYESAGLIQEFLSEEKIVIQLLNAKKLYAPYGLIFDKTGTLRSGAESIYRIKTPASVIIVLLPPLCLALLLIICRFRKQPVS
ncbi:hypothetical protein AGMMS49579_06080 [Spirochaetia bacterium]|nr:hypothetical protein AGMMS49579_06080 [Spirochaetia bacterium]